MLCCSSSDESRTCLRFCETLFTVGVSPDPLGNGCTMLWILHICINSSSHSRRNETSGIIKLLSLIKGQEKDSGRSSERCSEQPQKTSNLVGIRGKWQYTCDIKMCDLCVRLYFEYLDNTFNCYIHMFVDGLKGE